MLAQILLALGLACTTVAMHALGTVFVIGPAIGWGYTRSDATPRMPPLLTLIALISLLLVLHLAEMAVWAMTFAATGTLPNLESAFYYSLTSYTTVGYGDVIPPLPRRLLGPIEAAVGVLMLGWSTGIIVTVVQRLQVARRSSPGDDRSHRHIHEPGPR